MACKICGNNNCATYPGWSSIIRPCIPKDAKLGTPPSGGSSVTRSKDYYEDQSGPTPPPPIIYHTKIDYNPGNPPRTPPALGRPPIKNQPGIIPTDTYIETEMQTIIRLLTQIWSKMNES